MENHLEELQKLIRKTEEERMALMERYLMKQITREQFQREKKLMDDQIESCDQETIAIKEKIATLNEWQNVKIHDDYNRIQKCSAAQELTKELADMVIDQVYFYDKNHIEIRWKFTERFLEMIGWGKDVA